MIEFLLRRGSDLKKKSEGNWTPLHMAAAFNKGQAIAQTLIDAGANLKALDDDGFTPLQHASNSNENPAE